MRTLSTIASLLLLVLVAADAAKPELKVGMTRPSVEKAMTGGGWKLDMQGDDWDHWVRKDADWLHVRNCYYRVGESRTYLTRWTDAKSRR